MTFCRTVSARTGMVTMAVRQAAAKAKPIEVLRIMTITCDEGQSKRPRRRYRSAQLAIKIKGNLLAVLRWKVMTESPTTSGSCSGTPGARRGTGRQSLCAKFGNHRCPGQGPAGCAAQDAGSRQYHLGGRRIIKKKTTGYA